MAACARDAAALRQILLAAVVDGHDRETLLGYRNTFDAEAAHARKVHAAVLDGEVKDRWRVIAARNQIAARLIDAALGIAAPQVEEVAG